MTEQAINRRALTPEIDINGTFGDTATGLTPRFPARRVKMESEIILQTVADRMNKKIAQSKETGAPKQ